MELRVEGKKVYAATGGKPFDPALPAIVFMHGAVFAWVVGCFAEEPNQALHLTGAA